MLVERGADASIRDQSERTASEVASKAGFAGLSAMLADALGRQRSLAQSDAG
jgi:hypothetical protein